MLFLNIAGAGFASQGDAERAMKMCPLHMGCTWVAHGLHMGCTWVAHGLHMGCTWQVLVPSFVHPVLVATCCLFFSIFAPFRQIMS